MAATSEVASHQLTLHSRATHFFPYDTAHIPGSCCGVHKLFLGRDNSEQT